jgi:hypothetical protein
MTAMGRLLPYDERPRSDQKQSSAIVNLSAKLIEFHVAAVALSSPSISVFRNPDQL